MHILNVNINKHCYKQRGKLLFITDVKLVLHLQVSYFLERDCFAWETVISLFAKSQCSVFLQPHVESRFLIATPGREHKFNKEREHLSWARFVTGNQRLKKEKEENNEFLISNGDDLKGAESILLMVAKFLCDLGKLQVTFTQFPKIFSLIIYFLPGNTMFAFFFIIRFMEQRNVFYSSHCNKSGKKIQYSGMWGLEGKFAGIKSLNVFAECIINIYLLLLLTFFCCCSFFFFQYQQEGSLCAQHCLNNLLQGEYFSPVELSSIAQQLDEEERMRMAEGGVSSEEYRTFLQVKS